MPFLSISIDLSGSTLVKQAIVSLSGENDKHRKALYNAYKLVLYRMERNFYLNLLDRDGIDFSRLYLIKTIGDEFWYAYELVEGEGDINRTVAALFDAVLELFADERYLILSDSKGRHFERINNNEPASLKKFLLPIKAYIELITETIELNVERFDYLKDIVAKLQQQNAVVYDINQEYVEHLSRLNLGTGENNNGKHSIQSRADYIGLEVDRFFRVSKYCHPLLLAFGQNLIEKLNYDIEPVCTGLEQIGVKRLTLSSENGGTNQPPLLSKHVIQQAIPALMMKGLADGYTLYHLFGGDSLGDAVYLPPPGIETLMEPTRSFLAENGFYAIEGMDLLP